MWNEEGVKLIFESAATANPRKNSSFLGFAYFHILQRCGSTLIASETSRQRSSSPICLSFHRFWSGNLASTKLLSAWRYHISFKLLRIPLFNLLIWNFILFLSTFLWELSPSERRLLFFAWAIIHSLLFFKPLSNLLYESTSTISLYLLFAARSLLLLIIILTTKWTRSSSWSHLQYFNFRFHLGFFVAVALKDVLDHLLFLYLFLKIFRSILTRLFKGMIGNFLMVINHSGGAGWLTNLLSGLGSLNCISRIEHRLFDKILLLHHTQRNIWVLNIFWNLNFLISVVKIALRLVLTFLLLHTFLIFQKLTILIND